MNEHEAKMIANVLARDNPGHAFNVVAIKEGEGRKQTTRHAIKGPGGFELHYPWQYLEMRINTIASVQQKREQLIVPINNGALARR